MGLQPVIGRGRRHRLGHLPAVLRLPHHRHRVAPAERLPIPTCPRRSRPGGAGRPAAGPPAATPARPPTCAATLPVSGYIPPWQPAHQNIGSSGRPAEDAAQSAAQAAWAGRLANNAASGLSRKLTARRRARPGSSSEVQAMSSPPPSRQPRSSSTPIHDSSGYMVIVRVPDRALRTRRRPTTRCGPLRGVQPRVDGEPAQVGEAPGGAGHVDRAAPAPRPRATRPMRGIGEPQKQIGEDGVGRVRRARGAADGDRSDRDREDDTPSRRPRSGSRTARCRSAPRPAPDHRTASNRQRRQGSETAHHPAAPAPDADPGSAAPAQRGC